MTVGLNRVNGRRTSTSQRLEQLAVALAPARAPWWVANPTRQCPAQGWYWIPPGAKTPSFLGHNHIRAEVNLEQLRDAAPV